MTDLEHAIRHAIVASGVPLLQIAKAAGVSHPSLYHFANGKRGLTLETAGKLCDALGLEVVWRDDQMPLTSGAQEPL